MATRTARRASSPAEQVGRDEAKAARLAELHTQLSDQVAQLVNGDDWQAMLRAAARFHRYSLNNVLLIRLQFPGASRVAGYRTWQSLGRQVRKGEKGIAVLAPITCRTNGATEEGSDDQDAQTPGVRQLRGFKIEHVFDISQTDGESLPDVRPVLLEGDCPPELWDDVADMIRARGYQVRRGQCAHLSANGETDPVTRIVSVRDDLAPLHAIKTLTHELAHILLGHVEDVSSYFLCRGRCEVEAESVAFVVLLEAGIDASAYSTVYVAGWADGPKTVHETAGRVVDCARGIVERIGPAEDGGVTPRETVTTSWEGGGTQPNPEGGE
jgi:antirestriction protein ArdC